MQESATAWPNIEQGAYHGFLDLTGTWTSLTRDNVYPALYAMFRWGRRVRGVILLLIQAFYFNPDANELITKQRQETDAKVRDGYFGELQDILGEDVPYIPLWQNKDYVFAQGGIQNVSIEPTQQFLLWQVSK